MNIEQFIESNIEGEIGELRKQREEGKSHLSCYCKAWNIFYKLCDGNPEDKEMADNVFKHISKEQAFNLRIELDYFVNSIVDEKIKKRWKEIVTLLKEVYSC